MSTRKPTIGVIGASHPSPDGLHMAEAVGRAIAVRGAVLVCGGLDGVMEAAAKGASEAGGVVLGILPGPDKRLANPYVTLPVPTNMGHARNVIIAHTADSAEATGTVPAIRRPPGSAKTCLPSLRPMAASDRVPYSPSTAIKTSAV